MTIRLRCAECHRKLKVPDAALGKKVQCPACGARFREHSEASAPPAPPPSAELEMSPIDALFAEMASAPPSLPEQAASSPFPNLELEGSQTAREEEGIESLESEEAAEEPGVIEESVEEEIAEITDEAEDLDALDEIGDELADLGEEEAEVVEEAEPEEDEKRPKKKKKTNKLFFALIGVVLLIGVGALSFVGYRYFSDTPPDTRPVAPAPRRNPRVPPPPGLPPADPR